MHVNGFVFNIISNIELDQYHESLRARFDNFDEKLDKEVEYDNDDIDTCDDDKIEPNYCCWSHFCSHSLSCSH